MSMVSLDWSVPPSALAEEIAGYGQRLLEAVAELMRVFGARVEADAKAHAPWTDRTAHARQGLSTEVFEDTAAIALVLFHQASYGIWLEVRWGGRWSIIMKTLAHHFPAIMSAIAALIR